MILICLGTQDMAFKRLLECVSVCIKDGVIKEEVIAQCGITKFDSELIKCFDYCSNEEMSRLMDEASLVITHGGTGTIVEALKKGKKVIAMARRQEFDEHNDNHQFEIIEAFKTKGYLLDANNVEELASAIKAMDTFKVKKFESNQEQFLLFLRSYIDEVLGR